MHHSKHKYVVVQHLVAKIPIIIIIKEIQDNKKPSNSLNLLGLLKITGGDETKVDVWWALHELGSS